MTPPYPIPHVVYGKPLDTEGLAGTLRLRLTEEHSDFWTRGYHVLIVEQDLGGSVFAGWAMAPPAMVADPDAMHFATQIAVDALRPWRKPETWTGWPRAFVLLPRLDRLGRLLRAAKGRWGR